MIERGYMVTSRGLRRPLSVALWLFRSIKSSNEDQNNFPHIPKSLKAQLQSNTNDIRCDIMIKKSLWGDLQGSPETPFFGFRVMQTYSFIKMMPQSVFPYTQTILNTISHTPKSLYTHLKAIQMI